jgi:hypothetical protein
MLISVIPSSVLEANGVHQLKLLLSSETHSAAGNPAEDYVV